VGVSQPLRLLVDSRVHAEELARFESLVVRGRGAEDCAIWKGAIGGDGYGRYWVRRGCSERIMVRANRYALAAAQDGVALAPSVRALHGCDNTVCVRVSRPGETGLLHVVGGSQRDKRLAERVGLAGLPAGMLTRLELVAVQGIEELGQRPPGVAGLTVGVARVDVVVLAV